MAKLIGRITIIDDSITDDAVISIMRHYFMTYALGQDEADAEVSRDHYHFCGILLPEQTIDKLRKNIKYRFGTLTRSDYSLKKEEWDSTFAGYCVKTRKVSASEQLLITPWLEKDKFVANLKAKPHKEEFFDYVYPKLNIEYSDVYEQIAKHFLAFRKGKTSYSQVEINVNHVMWRLGDSRRELLEKRIAERVRRFYDDRA